MKTLSKAFSGQQRALPVHSVQSPADCSTQSQGCREAKLSLSAAAEAIVLAGIVHTHIHGYFIQYIQKRVSVGNMRLFDEAAPNTVADFCSWPIKELKELSHDLALAGRKSRNKLLILGALRRHYERDGDCASVGRRARESKKMH